MTSLDFPNWWRASSDNRTLPVGRIHLQGENDATDHLSRNQKMLAVHDQLPCVSLVPLTVTLG